MIVTVKDVKTSPIVTETGSKELSFDFMVLNYLLNFILKTSDCITFGEKAFLPLESQKPSLR